jgi:hypothetical protein
VGGDREPQTDKHLPPSTFTGKFLKRSQHLGFGVFLDIWSMAREHPLLPDFIEVLQEGNYVSRAGDGLEQLDLLERVR